MDKKTANILYAILIIAVISFMIFLIVWLKSDTTECVKNPVKYFTEKNEHLYCNCYDNNGMFVEGINEEVFRYGI